MPFLVCRHILRAAISFKSFWSNIIMQSAEMQKRKKKLKSTIFFLSLFLWNQPKPWKSFSFDYTEPEQTAQIWNFLYKPSNKQCVINSVVNWSISFDIFSTELRRSHLAAEQQKFKMKTFKIIKYKNWIRPDQMKRRRLFLIKTIKNQHKKNNKCINMYVHSKYWKLFHLIIHI